MKKYSFCGIAGSGMSPLAQILKWQGFEVNGSDRSFDQGGNEQIQEVFKKNGINLFPQDGSAIEDDVDCLVISTAVEETIPDVKKALQKNIKIIKRFDLLADMFHQYEKGIAVGGTSGKSTTTGMIGYILKEARKNPTIINGGVMKNLKEKDGESLGSAYYSDGDICVIEADESNGSIEKYNPYISVINNISLDHKTIDELLVLFSDFAGRAKHKIVMNLDCKYCQKLSVNKEKLKTFSLENEGADIYAYDIKPLQSGIAYKIDDKEFKLAIYGKHNVYNAIAAIAVAEEMGVDMFEAAKILEGYSGITRRLETIGVNNGISIIDDFGHNPDKINASMRALREYDGRLLVMFQPHGFSPIRLMGKDIAKVFAETLGSEDILLMPEIYYAGGSVVKDVSSKDVTDAVNKAGKKAIFFDNRKEIKDYLIDNVRSGDRIVIMGARDNSLTVFASDILDSMVI